MEHVIQPIGFSYVGPLGEWFCSKYMIQTSRIRIKPGICAWKKNNQGSSIYNNQNRLDSAAETNTPWQLNFLLISSLIQVAIL